MAGFLHPAQRFTNVRRSKAAEAGKLLVHQELER
jgi:hypothetical protein